ncbi:hypothetical protein ACFV84_36110 [Kitasatospora sp. NPDC059811]|uniref:hypothetical protein n=1 Tax=Streptomycetaceae TaxID=2062 RepID=UPI0007AF404E|nr:hypothetical protein [Streptomyces sp. MJM8645]
MPSDDNEEPVMVKRVVPGIDEPVIFHHGPVERKSGTQPFEVVSFTGVEESDILHAAGWWMADQPYAQIVALNWRVEDTEADTRRWILDLVVDHDSGAGISDGWRRATRTGSD